MIDWAVRYFTRRTSPDSHKSPSTTLQSTLNAFFLPTSFKYFLSSPDDTQKQVLEEVLKPGALYTECAVAPIHIPATLAPRAEKKTDDGNGRSPGGGTAQHDSGELGGMALGMEVKDNYGWKLNVWEGALTA